MMPRDTCRPNTVFPVRVDERLILPKAVSCSDRASHQSERMILLEVVLFILIIIIIVVLA